MFILQPVGGNAFDLDPLLTLLEREDVAFVHEVPNNWIRFLLNPATLQYGGGVLIVEAADFDQLCRIVRWVGQSQGFALSVMNDEDQISVEILPGQDEITEADIAARRISLGPDLGRFARALHAALLPPDPWNTRPTAPKEKTAVWLLQMRRDNPQIAGENTTRIRARRIYVWSTRRDGFFTGLGEEGAVFVRREPGSDVMGLMFPGYDLIIDRCVEDENAEGAPRYLCRGDLRVFGPQEAYHDADYLAQALLTFGRTMVNPQEDQIAIDMEDGVFSARRNGGFWVKEFHWNDGNVRVEDRFVAAR